MTQQNTGTVDLDVTITVPRCRRKHPRDYPSMKNCPDCVARRRWVRRVADDEKKRGVYRTKIDAGPLREWVKKLVESGHTYNSIGAECGVSGKTITDFMYGRHPNVLPSTYDAVMSVQPSKLVTHRRARYDAEPLRSPCGIIRILQGLQSQGWSFVHMAEILGVGRPYLTRIPHLPQRMVTRGTIDKIERLADKLGPYDINELDEPLPGMDVRVRNRAARLGWIPLSDWDGIDIHDPGAKPHGYEEPDSDPLDGWMLIEPEKIAHALDEGEMRSHVRFPVLFTEAELYHLVREGSTPDGVGSEPRFSAEGLAARTGVTSRTIQRIRVNLVYADQLATVPAASAVAAARILTAAAAPPAARLAAAARILAPIPFGRGHLRDESRFLRHFVTLSLIHPQPHGLGWSDEDLAAWMRSTEEEAIRARRNAVVAGRQYYDPQGKSRQRRIGVELPAAA